MLKLLKVLVVLQLLAAIAALYWGIMLFQQRELLKGRTQKLERSLIAVAATVEDQRPSAGDKPDYPARDTDKTTSELNPNPARTGFWDSYRSELEKAAFSAINLNNRREELGTFYRIDPATLKPMRDPLTGERITDGPGTMQDLLNEVLAKSVSQHDCLGDTRDQLRIVREELVSSVVELNTRKQDLRVALNTVVARDQSIARLEGTVRERDGTIAARDKEIAGLQDTVRENEATIAKRDADIEGWKRTTDVLEAKLAEAYSPNGPNGRRATPEALLMTRGQKGKVIGVSKEWNFVVLELNKEFLDQYKAVVEKYKLDPDLELMVMQKAGTKQPFVTKIHICRVNPTQGIGVADILTSWQQKDVSEGDQVWF